MHKPLAAAFAVAVATACGGSDMACTAIGASDVVSVDARAVPGASQVGMTAEVCVDQTCRPRQRLVKGEVSFVPLPTSPPTAPVVHPSSRGQRSGSPRRGAPSCKYRQDPERQGPWSRSARKMACDAIALRRIPWVATVEPGRTGRHA